jgi:hypothetical protein
MTIYTHNGSPENIPAALEKLEELKKLAAGMGGRVVEYRITKECPERPIIDILENEFYLRVDIRLPLTASNADTPELAAEAAEARGEVTAWPW